MRILLIGGVVLGSLGVLGLAGMFWYYGRDLPTVAALKSYHPPQITRIVDRHGEVLGEVFEERRTVVGMKRIPRVLVLSVLAAEDADFYRHPGIDYPGILRAFARDVLHGHVSQGASTITQQVVKLMLLTPRRTISRKMREMILARRLEKELTKDQILHLYLNTINFGHGRYGVEEASRYYFGKDVSQLNLAEASLIAGLPQSPGRLSPRDHPEAARRRQRYVLDQLDKKRAEYWPDLTHAERSRRRAGRRCTSRRRPRTARPHRRSSPSRSGCCARRSATRPTRAVATRCTRRSMRASSGPPATPCARGSRRSTHATATGDRSTPRSRRAATTTTCRLRRLTSTRCARARATSGS